MKTLYKVSYSCYNFLQSFCFLVLCICLRVESLSMTHETVNITDIHLITNSGRRLLQVCSANQYAAKSVCNPCPFNSISSPGSTGYLSCICQAPTYLLVSPVILTGQIFSYGGTMPTETNRVWIVRNPLRESTNTLIVGKAITHWTVTTRSGCVIQPFLTSVNFNIWGVAGEQTYIINCAGGSKTILSAGTHTFTWDRVSGTDASCKVSEYLQHWGWYASSSNCLDTTTAGTGSQAMLWMWPNSPFNSGEYYYNSAKSGQTSTRNVAIRLENKPAITDVPTLMSCENCAANTYWNSGVCTSCPQYSTSPSGTSSILGCACNINMYLNGTVCVNCPVGSTTSAAGSTSISQCVCSANKYMSGGVCQSCPAYTTSPVGSTSLTQCTCPTGSTLDEGVCKCNANSYGTDGTCTSCPTSATSPLGSTLITQCTCPADSSLIDGVCKCNANYFFKSGGCIGCSEGFVSPVGSTSSSQCVCPAGTTLDGGVCKCNANSYGSNGVCNSCPVGSTSPLGTTAISNCVCDAGLQRIGDTCVATTTSAPPTTTPAIVTGQSVPPPQEYSYTHTGSLIQLTLPTDIVKVEAKMWGGGGGGFGKYDGITGSGGGGGGYTQGSFNVPAGQQYLYIVVGGGGSGTTDVYPTLGAYPGGGILYADYSRGGQGGGRSSITMWDTVKPMSGFNTYGNRTKVMLVAGGGGGGGMTAVGSTEEWSKGRAGGGLSGNFYAGASLPGTQTGSGITTTCSAYTNTFWGGAGGDGYYYGSCGIDTTGGGTSGNVGGGAGGSGFLCATCIGTTIPGGDGGASVPFASDPLNNNRYGKGGAAYSGSETTVMNCGDACKGQNGFVWLRTYTQAQLDAVPLVPTTSSPAPQPTEPNSINVNISINGVEVPLSDFIANLPSNIGVVEASQSDVILSQTCEAGYYCPLGTSDVIPCPAGTFFNGTNANTLDQCLPCIAGSYCPLASITPIQCQANTYAAPGSGVCLNCTSGSVSSPGSAECSCVVGHKSYMDRDFTYSIVGSATYRAYAHGIPDGVFQTDGYCNANDVCFPLINGKMNINVTKGARLFLNSVGFQGNAPFPLIISRTISSAWSSDPTVQQIYERIETPQVYLRIHETVAKSDTTGLELHASAGLQGQNTANIVWDTSNETPGLYYIGTTWSTGTKTKMLWTSIFIQDTAVASISAPYRTNGFLFASEGDSLLLTGSGTVYITLKHKTAVLDSILTSEILPYTYTVPFYNDSYALGIKGSSDTNDATYFHIWVRQRSALVPVKVCNKCEPGTYQSLPDQSTCSVCPAGYICRDNGTVTPEICPVGTFCPNQTAIPSNCSAGTFQNSTGATSSNDCMACIPGNYCPVGSVNPINCAAGTFKSTSGASTCDVCPKGQYCGVATVTPNNCSAGSYRSTTGGASQSDCDACITGNYCPSGSITPTTCAAGSYRESTGAQSQDDCGACPPAYYCPSASTTPSACPAGTFRGEPRATSATDCATCITGNYCPSPSYEPTNCSSGTFRNLPGGTSQSDCSACLVAQYCPLASTTPVDCPNGTYRSTTGATSLADCAVCVANSYCPRRSTNPTACPSKTYSPAGSDSLLDCKCAQGYQCVITKVITATVTLNATKTDFDNNVGNVKTNFIAAVAAAAGVSPSKVSIVGVSPRFGGRRLLSVFAGGKTDNSIVVRAKVHGATSLNMLDVHLSRHNKGLHMGHEWRESHSVKVVPE